MVGTRGGLLRVGGAHETWLRQLWTLGRMCLSVPEVLPGRVRRQRRQHVGEHLERGHPVGRDPAVGPAPPLQDQREGAFQLRLDLSSFRAMAFLVGVVPGDDRADPGAGVRVERLEPAPTVLVEDRPAVDQQDRGVVGLGVLGPGVCVGPMRP